MNELLLPLGLAWIKPFLTAAALPPVPFLVLSAFAIASMRRRRGRVAVLGTSLALTWLSGCLAVGEGLARVALPAVPALDPVRLEALRAEAAGPVAIVVLGGGVDGWAPEFQAPSLRFPSLERLRYGVWLGRRIDWPVAFSGGLGWAQSGTGAREAVVAQRVATEEYGRPLKWAESGSRDTRENALFTAALLKPAGVRHIVLVTHTSHMPRSLRNFRTAFGPSVDIEAAPIGLARRDDWPVLRWIPSGEGFLEVRTVVREWLGLLGGA